MHDEEIVTDEFTLILINWNRNLPGKNVVYRVQRYNYLGIQCIDSLSHFAQKSAQSRWIVQNRNVTGWWQLLEQKRPSSSQWPVWYPRGVKLRSPSGCAGWGDLSGSLGHQTALPCPKGPKATQPASEHRVQGTEERVTGRGPGSHYLLSPFKEQDASLFLASNLPSAAVYTYTSSQRREILYPSWFTQWNDSKKKLSNSEHPLNFLFIRAFIR